MNNLVKFFRDTGNTVGDIGLDFFFGQKRETPIVRMVVTSPVAIPLVAVGVTLTAIGNVLNGDSPF